MRIVARGEGAASAIFFTSETSDFPDREERRFSRAAGACACAGLQVDDEHGAYRMHASAVEKPSSMRAMGMRKAIRRALWIEFTSRPPSSVAAVGWSPGEGCEAMAVIMEAKSQVVKVMERASRMRARSTCFRKYLRRVMRAARWDEEERAQM